LGIRCWNFGTPFFPLVESGFDRLGSDLVDPITDLELGLAEDLSVRLGGEQLGDALDFVLDDGQETTLDPVGFVALFGRQIEWETEHGKGPP
jgi:hypothetical protein